MAPMIGRLLLCNNKDAEQQRGEDDAAMVALAQKRYGSTSEAVGGKGMEMLEIAEKIRDLAVQLQQQREKQLGSSVEQAIVSTPQLDESLQQSLLYVNKSLEHCDSMDASVKSSLMQASSSLMTSCNEQTSNDLATPKSGNLTIHRQPSHNIFSINSSSSSSSSCSFFRTVFATEMTPRHSNVSASAPKSAVLPLSSSSQNNSAMPRSRNVIEASLAALQSTLNASMGMAKPAARARPGSSRKSRSKSRGSSRSGGGTPRTRGDVGGGHAAALVSSRNATDGAKHAPNSVRGAAAAAAAATDGGFFPLLSSASGEASRRVKKSSRASLRSTKTSAATRAEENGENDNGCTPHRAAAGAVATKSSHATVIKHAVPRAMASTPGPPPPPLAGRSSPSVPSTVPLTRTVKTNPRNSSSELSRHAKNFQQYHHAKKTPPKSPGNTYVFVGMDKYSTGRSGSSAGLKSSVTSGDSVGGGSCSSNLSSASGFLSPQDNRRPVKYRTVKNAFEKGFEIYLPDEQQHSISSIDESPLGSSSTPSDPLALSRYIGDGGLRERASLSERLHHHQRSLQRFKHELDNCYTAVRNVERPPPSGAVRAVIDLLDGRAVTATSGGGNGDNSAVVLPVLPPKRSSSSCGGSETSSASKAARAIIRD